MSTDNTTQLPEVTNVETTEEKKQSRINRWFNIAGVILNALVSIFGKKN